MLDDFFITLPEGIPASAEVQEYAAKHSHLAAKGRDWPVWALVCVWVGALVSVGTGAFLITVGAGL